MEDVANMICPVEARLAELGIILPEPASPIASYVPCVEHDGLLHVSGQLPFRGDGSLIKGCVGYDISPDEAVEAARACGVMVLAQARLALGSLSKIRRVVKLGVFINSVPDFEEQPQIANGASKLMEAVFDQGGRHARSAVGVASLPLGVAVEVDAILAVTED